MLLEVEISAVSEGVMILVVCVLVIDDGEADSTYLGVSVMSGKLDRKCSKGRRCIRFPSDTLSLPSILILCCLDEVALQLPIHVCPIF